jgi:hypothetical protein
MIRHERTSLNGLLGVQAPELRQHPQQEKAVGQNGIEEVLPFLPEAYPS